MTFQESDEVPDGAGADLPCVANEAGCFLWTDHVVRLDRVGRYVWGRKLGMDLDCGGDVDRHLAVRERLVPQQLRG